METRVEKTQELHDRGYNCAQAVGCAYCDLVGISEDEMFRMLEGYGLGMGCMEGICGAVSGAVALAGLKNSQGCANPISKRSTYQLSGRILKEFKEKNGSAICRELKGVDTGRALRACNDCIRDAAELAEKILFAEEA